MLQFMFTCASLCFARCPMLSFAAGLTTFRGHFFATWWWHAGTTFSFLLSNAGNRDVVQLRLAVNVADLCNHHLWCHHFLTVINTFYMHRNIYVDTFTVKFTFPSLNLIKWLKVNFIFYFLSFETTSTFLNATFFNYSLLFILYTRNSFSWWYFIVLI